MSQCLIGLGANLEHPTQTIETAIKLLVEGPFRGLLQSSVYQTDAVGPAQQPYANAAVCATTQLSPPETLEYLKTLERKLGRKRGERWGPRQIDLDLLLHGNSIRVDGDLQPWLWSPPHLVVPHPWLLVRRFALEPSVEVAPEMVHPIIGQPLKKVFFQTIGKGVSPSLVVVSVVGGGLDYRQQLTTMLAENLDALLFGQSVAVVADPSPDASELSCTQIREASVASASIAAQVVVAPFEVFRSPPSVVGLIDPDYSLYKSQDSEWFNAARKRIWPYVMLSGDLETDVQTLTMAYQSSR